MSDPDEPSPQRFPYAAAVFCAACVGVAAWLFFKWSYAWDVTPAEMDEASSQVAKAGRPSRRPDNRWLDGRTREFLKWLPSDVRLSLRHPLLGRYVRARGDRRPGDAVGDAAGSARAFSGRVVYKSRRPRTDLDWPYLAVDTTRSRWTGESAAGLVVGAMGVFIFALAFRHWWRQRRTIPGAAGTGLSGDTKPPAPVGPP